MGFHDGLLVGAGALSGIYSGGSATLHTLVWSVFLVNHFGVVGGRWSMLCDRQGTMVQVLSDTRSHYTSRSVEVFLVNHSGVVGGRCSVTVKARWSARRIYTHGRCLVTGLQNE